MPYQRRVPKEGVSQKALTYLQYEKALRLHSEVLIIAKKLGYKEVVCNFCRSPDSFSGLEEHYDVKNTELLPNPKTYPWFTSKPTSMLSRIKAEVLRL